MDLVQKEEAMVPASSLASTAVCLERWLGRMVEVPVAVLTALEVLILLALRRALLVSFVDARITGAISS